MRVPVGPVLVFLAAPLVAAAGDEPRAFFGLPAGDDPITPDRVPMYASADGQKIGWAPASRKLGCDPQDIYGEGRCDFEVTFEIRQADGAPLEKVKLVLGNWKKRTDVGALAARVAAHGLERGTSVEMGDRLYTFGGGRKLVIDARDKRMRLRVLAADDRVIDERMLPRSAPGAAPRRSGGPRRTGSSARDAFSSCRAAAPGPRCKSSSSRADLLPHLSPGNPRT
jgi:hypothetical protein